MAEDEAVRDFKKSLRQNEAGASGLRSSRSLPELSPPPLHPDIGRVRDIAQPGGFRRDHIMRSSSSISSEVAEVVSRPLLQTLLDPRVRLFLQPHFEVEDDDIASLPPGGSSDIATILVILKSTIGGTLIVIPGGFMGAGLFAASACLVILGFAEIYCMALLVHCSRVVGEGSSFGDIARQATGRIGNIAVDVSLLLSQIGFTCTEMLYVAKNCHGAIQALNWHGVAEPMLSITGLLLLQLVLTVPMSWIRKLKYFQASNLIANVTVLVALSIILGFSTVGLAQDGVAGDLQMIGPTWIMFAGTAVFSFECINFILPMYESHEKKETFIPILVGTLSGVILLFIVFGALCYVRYGGDTQPVVTLNLPGDSVVGKAMPLAFALASLLNIPLFLFPATTLIEDKLFLQSSSPSAARMWSKNLLRTCLTLLCAGISVVGKNSIQALVALVGSLCCVPLAFIYPVLFHILLCKPRPAFVIFECAVGCLGTIMFVVTTMQALQDF